MKLQENLHYVGVNDRTKGLFEGLWPVPNGVSYNAYLLTDERTALVDTVDVTFFETYLREIRRIIGNRPIDYLIINHMEPDHSGSINLIRKYYPNITLVGNALTLRMVDGFYGAGGQRMQVDDGDTLSLGSRTLRFHLIPMVHWPETMVTLDERAGILFSGDAFGCFGALNGGVVDTAIDTTPYWDEMVRYYANIVGRYGMQVQRALQKLAPYRLQMICSTHGPVWTEQMSRVVSLYDRLSRSEADEGLVICYASMYGNTLRMAETIARAASEAGLHRIVMHDVSRTHPSYILADVFRYRGLVVGAPTYNGGLFPAMNSLLHQLADRRITRRLLGCFGSFTWSGQALRHILRLTAGMAPELVSPPVEMRQGRHDEVEASCIALGQQMALRMKEVV